MIVKSKIRIKYNGERYNLGDIFEIEEKHFESIKDMVEIVEELPENDEDNSDEEIELDQEEIGLPFDDLRQENPIHNAIDYNSLTKPEIVEILRERGIEYNSKDKKEDLVKLLVGSD